MTTNDTNPTIPTSPRPFGFWLRLIDRRIDDAMRELFAAEGITRRDWRRLNLIAGTVTDPRMTERLASRPERVAPLVERGWVAGEPGAWRLTESGDAARAALHERVSSLRTKVAGAVSPEDFATTLASLEAIARELGWSEDERMPRRHGRGFGRRHGEGFGRRPRAAGADTARTTRAQHAPASLTSAEPRAQSTPSRRKPPLPARCLRGLRNARWPDPLLPHRRRPRRSAPRTRPWRTRPAHRPTVR